MSRVAELALHQPPRQVLANVRKGGVVPKVAALLRIVVEVVELAPVDIVEDGESPAVIDQRPQANLTVEPEISRVSSSGISSGEYMSQ